MDAFQIYAQIVIISEADTASFIIEFQYRVLGGPWNGRDLTFPCEVAAGSK